MYESNIFILLIFFIYILLKLVNFQVRIFNVNVQSVFLTLLKITEKCLWLQFISLPYLRVNLLVYSHSQSIYSVSPESNESDCAKFGYLKIILHTLNITKIAPSGINTQLPTALPSIYARPEVFNWYVVQNASYVFVQDLQIVQTMTF